MLRFVNGNAKLDQAIFTFSLPAGHFCPFADKCKSQADRFTGRVTDGKNTTFRCYAASDEARSPQARSGRWHNAQQLLACKGKAEMVNLILASLSKFAFLIRIHESGDFFSQAYFDAWLEVARQRPRATFYFYTKSLRYWTRRIEQVGNGYSPGEVGNVVPTASYGGKNDNLIEEYGLRSVKVVHSIPQAKEMGLELDHDDSHAMTHGPDFSLLIHGTQPGGSEAGKALSALRAAGEFGYGKQADKRRELVMV